MKVLDPQSSHILNPDTQAVLLLCGRFGRAEESPIKPLTAGEYNALAEWLRSHNMRPSDLLSADGLETLESAGLAVPVSFPRLKSLLERGGGLAIAVESWTNKGLWVISRSDQGYPKQLREGRLGPPILYGVGDMSLLEMGGLAIVGSREVDEDVLDFTCRVAQACALQGIQVMSGGARGVDTEAMLAAIEAGGTSVGVLSDSLLKAAVAGKYRPALVEGRLALISPYDPGAGFDVGTAMGRNKYIYGLADWALIVNSSAEKGGTWGGAVEALKAGKTPVFVRVGSRMPDGNRKLLEKGALSFPDEPWNGLVISLSYATTSLPANGVVQEQMLIEEEPAPYRAPGSAVQAAVREEHPEPSLPGSVYETVLPLILSHLHEPQDVKSLAEALEVRPAQLLDWLDRAAQEGKVLKTGRPARFIVAPPRLDLSATA
jgi:predicted Rossmann fold nucleotide-binding protein DprA/Smf involved in DNA uptake